MKKEVAQPVVEAAPTFTEWQDMQVNEVNRLPLHATFFAYENEATALKGEPQNSKNFVFSRAARSSHSGSSLKTRG